MHCVLTADLAALLAHHGTAILYRRDTIEPETLAGYWAASKSRMELWHQTMARYGRCERAGNADALRRWWHEHAGVLEEVLVSEMLTRVVAAMAAALEGKRGCDEMVPVTHAVYLSHLEARNRVQRIMLFGRGSSVHDSVRLNRLRQGVERWIDALIGRMPMQIDGPLQYAIDPDRAAEYAAELRTLGNDSARRTTTWLMNAAMHDLLRRRTLPAAALPAANRNVAQSVLQMLRPGLFDGIGLLKSVWLHRLELGIEKTDQLLHPRRDQEAWPQSFFEDEDHPGDPQFERWYS